MQFNIYYKLGANMADILDMIKLGQELQDSIAKSKIKHSMETLKGVKEKLNEGNLNEQDMVIKDNFETMKRFRMPIVKAHQSLQSVIDGIGSLRQSIKEFNLNITSRDMAKLTDSTSKDLQKRNGDISSSSKELQNCAEDLELQLESILSIFNQELKRGELVGENKKLKEGTILDKKQQNDFEKFILRLVKDIPIEFGKFGKPAKYLSKLNLDVNENEVIVDFPEVSSNPEKESGIPFEILNRVPKIERYFKDLTNAKKVLTKSLNPKNGSDARKFSITKIE
jgi:hypothetical protein